MKTKFLFFILLASLTLIIATFFVINALGNSNSLIKLESFGSSLSSKPSPQDAIQKEDIKVYSDRVVIFIKDASLASYAPTGSMLPVLGSEANGLEIPVTNSDQIKVGDIIVFQQADSNDLIAHRVKKIGTDKEGWYCITQGDNAPLDDGRIRLNQIKFKTIVIIY